MNQSDPVVEIGGIALNVLSTQELQQGMFQIIVEVPSNFLPGMHLLKLTNNAGTSQFPVQLLSVPFGENWEQATDAAAWPERKNFATVVFNGKMWVLGGAFGHASNDIWSSDDGVTWTQVQPEGPIWNPRFGHNALVFEDKIWVTGGITFNPQTQSLNIAGDIWSSDDGIHWSNIGPGGNGTFSSAAVFNGRMYFLGGDSIINDPTSNNWYRSTANGVDWEFRFAPWTGRRSFAAVAFDNKLWIIGGSNNTQQALSDVWWTSDGINWTKATDNPPWVERYGHTALVFNNKIYMLGGVSSNSSKNDIWSTTNGTEWKLVTQNADWVERQEHSSVVFDNKMWVLGGNIQAYPNTARDVWHSSP